MELCFGVLRAGRAMGNGKRSVSLKKQRWKTCPSQEGWSGLNDWHPLSWSVASIYFWDFSPAKDALQSWFLTALMQGLAGASPVAAVPPDGARQLTASPLLTNCTAVVLHVSTCVVDLQRQTGNVLYAGQWPGAIAWRQPPWGSHGEQDEWGIHLQPCKDRHLTAARPAVQLKEVTSKNALNTCSVWCVDITLTSNSIGWKAR